LILCFLFYNKLIFNIFIYKQQNIIPSINYRNVKPHSLDDLFNSKRLYISDANLTQKYINFIRKINKTRREKIYLKEHSERETLINPKFFRRRKDQYNYRDFLNLCVKNELITNTNEIKYNKSPLISIILPSYNKQDSLMISIRSIQNQSLKNIEIIIVDDCSTDNSTEYFKYLLKTDSRIRVFTHLKNMGVWRTRLDGFLYSKGKYFLFFDTGDLYEDNYVLEDLYTFMEKYNLDSAKMLFRLIFNYNNSISRKLIFHVNNNSKIEFGTENITKMNRIAFNGWRNIWNRITKSNIYTKALHLLNDRVLNIYKNLYEDRWHNALINIVSHNFTVVDRIGYLYYRDGKGYGEIRLKTKRDKDKTIQEYINFLIFDYFYSSKPKTTIVSKLKEYNNHKSKIKLSYFKSNFYILNDLLNLLIKDPSISFNDKIFLNLLLKKSKIRAKKANN